MEKIAVESIRKAAKRVYQLGKVVTLPLLARELSKQPGTVYWYVVGIKGLKDELEASFGYGMANGAAKKYLEAAQRLDEANLYVTHRRIAFLTGSNKRAVAEFFFKRKNRKYAFVIVSEHRFQYLLFVKRMTLIIEAMRKRGERTINKSELAKCLDIERQHLHRVLRRDPALKRSLGL